jgi:MFS transporter, FSR family, fosmidomycin resistance protein
LENSDSAFLGKRKTLSALASYHAFNDGFNTLLPVLLPLIRDEFGLKYKDTGSLVACGLFIVFLLQPITGFLSDKFNSKYLLNMGLLGYAILSLTLIFIDSFRILFLIVIFISFFASIYHPVGFSYNIRYFTKDLKDQALGIQVAASGAAIFFLLLISPTIGKMFNWRYPFALWSLITISGVFLLSKNLEKYHVNEATYFDWFSLKKIILHLLVFLIPISFGGIVYNTIIVYSPFLMTDKLHISKEIMGLILAIWILSGVLSNFYFGKITKTIDKKILLLSAYLICGIVGLILAITSNIFILISSLIIIGFFQFSTYPAIFSLISDNIPLKNMGIGFGIVFSYQILGGSIFSYINGVAADRFGISIPFHIMSFVSFFTAIYFYITYKKYNPTIATCPKLKNLRK